MEKGLKTGLTIGIIISLALIVYSNFFAVCFDGCPIFPGKLSDFIRLILFLLIPAFIGYLAGRFFISKRESL